MEEINSNYSSPISGPASMLPARPITPPGPNILAVQNILPASTLQTHLAELYARDEQVVSISAATPGRHAKQQPPKRRSRKKRSLAWEQAELASNGLYERYLQEIALHFPTLTQMELRVAAMVKAMLPSWRIGELLGIREESVERCRCRIRSKLEIHDERLQSVLAKI